MHFLRFFCITAALLLSWAATGQDAKHILTGRITDKSSGEALWMATVQIPEIGKATNSDSTGFYSIEVPETDTLKVEFSFYGYKSVIKSISVSSDVKLDISLAAEEHWLEEIVLKGPVEKEVSEGAEISNIEVPIEQIKDIPTLMGEKDVLKTLQLMPGVQSGNEGMAGLYVRGGGPGENLFLLDNAQVYNPYHLFGFFSSFNGDALEKAELIKGGFPARYGGRLSSVVDMEVKKGNPDSLTGEAGIGLIASRFMLEGPIKKDKSSFMISGRRTYIDALVYPFLPSEFRAGYYFYDLTGKVTYDFNAKNKIYFSGYLGKDNFYAKAKFEDSRSKMNFGWANKAATLAWDHIYSEKARSQSSLIYSGYKFNINQEDKYNNEIYFLEYLSTVRDISLKHQFEFFPSDKHTIRTGAMVTHHTFNPEAMVYQHNLSSQDVDFNNRTFALESALFLEDTYKPVKRLTIDAGIRLSSYLVDGKHYMNPEPRLSVGYKIKNDLAVKAGFASMNQYIHQLTSGGIGLPIDLWVPTTKNVKPAQSRQVTLGMAKDFLKKKMSFTIEGYYKKTDRMLGYKEGASFLLSEDPAEKGNNSWERNVIQGQGWSYGLELLLHKKSGKFSGWAAYTLSWTQLQFDSVNFGEKFYARYDRRHDISLVGIYKISEKIHLSGTWVYGTGNALTLPNAVYFPFYHIPGAPQDINNSVYSGYPRNYYKGKNQFRMSAYHRLDISIQFIKKLSRGRERTWDLSIYNVYSRQNPFFYFYQQEYQNGESKMVLKQISMFPILPSITYNLKF